VMVATVTEAVAAAAAAAAATGCCGGSCGDGSMMRGRGARGGHRSHCVAIFFTK